MSDSLRPSLSLIDRLFEIGKKPGVDLSLEELIEEKIKIINKMGANSHFLKLIDHKLDAHKKLMPKDKFYFEKAIIYYNFGYLDIAFENFKQAYEANLSMIDYFYYQKITLLEICIKKDHENSYLYNEKGIYLDKLELYKNAIDYFDLAIDLDPSRASYHFNKANTLNKLKLFKPSNESYLKALELNPNNVEYLYMKEINLIDFEIENGSDLPQDELYNMKGCFFVKLRDYKKAIKAFDEAINLKQKPDYLYHKGIALSELYDCLSADVYFKNAIELNPKKYDYKVYQKINVINNYLKSNPNDANFFNKKGLYLTKLDDFASALRCFNKASEIDPDDKIFRHNRNQLLEMEKLEP